jgi:AcrR family transcriptional regulator
VPAVTGTGTVIGLRERRKVATRAALHEAAVQLAVERGFDRVTVEAIADRAGVSRRTFSNYFASKEEALFHGDTERLGKMLELVRAEPGDMAPWSVLTRVAERLIGEWGGDLDPAELARRRELLRDPALVVPRDSAYTRMEAGLADELARRLTGRDTELRARVLAATFLATLRVAIHHWIDHPEGALLTQVRTALRHGAHAP